MISTMAKRKQYTYEDYAKLPEGAPYQLIRGCLVMTPAPTPNHQSISREIEFALLHFVREHKSGAVFYAPIDVYLKETETYQPDIIFIASDRRSIIGEKKIEGAPDLVVEILSPSTGYYDLRSKRDVYEASGVKEYWIVDPEDQSIEIYENAEGKFQMFSQARSNGLVKSKLLQGFVLDLETIFVEF